MPDADLPPNLRTSSTKLSPLEVLYRMRTI